MNRSRQPQPGPKQGVDRALPWIVHTLAVCVFAAVIAFILFSLRQSLRDQVILRESQGLEAAVRLKLIEAMGDDDELEEVTPLELLIPVLEGSRVGGVLAIRVYGPDGTLAETFPGGVTPAELDPDALTRLKAFEAVSEFHASGSVERLYASEREADPTPLLHVWLPLHRGDSKLLGISELVLAAPGLATELAQTDRALLRHGLGAFALGAAVLITGLHIAFRRLQRTNQLLNERTQSLIRANDELAMSAKTSALGAVTAHLIHGLKNPLFGLQHFVSAPDPSQRDATDWQHAVASTTRMQAMIQEIVRILQEDGNGAGYEMTLQEIVDGVLAKVNGHAGEAGVVVHTEVRGEAACSNHHANLIALILENLSENAIQASPPRAHVTLTATVTTGGVMFDVTDQGPGLPAEIQVALFTPCKSGKAGGSGLGLAICKQLADKLEGQLCLLNSSAHGATFRLILPARLLARATPAVAV